MTTRTHYLNTTTHELLCDLVARMDHLLVSLRESHAEFIEDLRADQPQGSSRSNDQDPPELIIVNPTIENLLATHRNGRRSLHQTLLELHVLHTKLGTLIMELESSVDCSREPAELTDRPRKPGKPLARRNH